MLGFRRDRTRFFAKISCPIFSSGQHTNERGQAGESIVADQPRSKSEKIATVDEISEAVEKVLPEEWVKLNAYGNSRARFMALYGGAYDGPDLVKEAIIALLEERRTWNPKKVNFVGVLMGAMKSIASNYKEKSLASGYSLPDSQVATEEEDGETVSVIEQHPDSRRSPEQQVLVKERQEGTTAQLADIYEFFQADAEAQLVMDGWRDGLSGTAIMETLEIDRTKYETIVRRIRRKSTGRWPKEGNHVS